MRRNNLKCVGYLKGYEIPQTLIHERHVYLYHSVDGSKIIEKAVQSERLCFCGYRLANVSHVFDITLSHSL